MYVQYKINIPLGQVLISNPDYNYGFLCDTVRAPPGADCVYSDHSHPTKQSNKQKLLFQPPTLRCKPTLTTIVSSYLPYFLTKKKHVNDASPCDVIIERDNTFYLLLLFYLFRHFHSIL